MKFSDMKPGQRFMSASNMICMKLADGELGKDLFVDGFFMARRMPDVNSEYEILREEARTVRIDNLVINA